MDSELSTTSVFARKVPTSVRTLTVIGALAILLLGTNILLILKNRTIERQLRSEISAYHLANFAPSGRLLPILSGFDLSGGSFKVDPKASGQFLLLLFDPTCAASEENWPNWNTLIDDQGTQRHAGVLFVSTMPVPSEYAERHSLKRFSAMFGLQHELLTRYQLRVTPQTVLVRHGQIVHSWGGVLSGTDLADIREALLLGRK